MVGGLGSEAEETEAFEPTLEKPGLTERQETFRYLKEFRRQKRHKQKLEREDRVREEMRIEVDQILQADAERSRTSERTTREITSGGAMAAKRTSARKRTPADGIDDDIPYVRNDKGELVPYDDIQYVKDANGNLVPDVPPPPRRFTQADRERANRNRDRYARSSWGKRLRASRRQSEGNKGAV